MDPTPVTALRGTGLNNGCALFQVGGAGTWYAINNGSTRLRPELCAPGLCRDDRPANPILGERVDGVRQGTGKLGRVRRRTLIGVDPQPQSRGGQAVALRCFHGMQHCNATLRGAVIQVAKIARQQRDAPGRIARRGAKSRALCRGSFSTRRST